MQMRSDWRTRYIARGRGVNGRNKKQKDEELTGQETPGLSDEEPTGPKAPELIDRELTSPNTQTYG